MRRAITVGLVILIGLGAGLAGGVALGWEYPRQAPEGTPAMLAPVWRGDYILMTSQAYSLDGDLAGARQRLSELGEEDLGSLVALRGLTAIADNEPPENIGRLARLAAALGARRPELEPYMDR